MSDPTNARRQKIYKKLKEDFKVLRALLNPHLDLTTLTHNGIDVSYTDLSQGTKGASVYFHPMSQSRLESLDERPTFRVMFTMEDPQWNYSDCHVLAGALSKQLQISRTGSLFQAIETTKWRLKAKRSCMESRLYEHSGGDASDPTRQHDWDLLGVFETDPLPHQFCMSMHAVPDVSGPLRSEMMIIVGVMSARMRRRRFKDQEIFPLLMVSVIGRTARIIQAHICLRDERLKVSYSQLFDFSYDTSAKKDLFLRWLMSHPIAETKPIPDAEEPSTSPAGDTAPQITAYETQNTIRSLRCCEDLPNSFMAMSLGSTVSVT